MSLASRLRSRFVRGIIAGIAIVVFGRIAINATPVADWMVAPLLVDDGSGPADAIVVLGAGVIGDCEVNQNGFRRVLMAARQWRERRTPIVLMSGGTGLPSCPVAEVMARLAREMGISESVVRVEKASRNTHENGVLAASMLKGWGVRRVLLVTDRLHMARASAVYSQQGFVVLPRSVPIYESHVDNVSMLKAGIREYLALAYYRARGWIGGLPSPAVEVAARYPSEEQRPRPDGPMVLLGASYAESWPIDVIAGVPVLNRGVAGQESFELLERFERDVIAAQPRAVILWGFINDIFRAPSGGTEAAAVRAQESFVRMIEMARAHDIVPILATEITARPRSNSLMDVLLATLGALRGKPSYQDQVNVHVFRINTWLKETAEREQLLLLDFQSVLAGADGRRHPLYAQPDGSHVTAAGYDALTTYAQPILEELLVVR